MLTTITNRVKKAWNAFLDNKEELDNYTNQSVPVAYGRNRPDRLRYNRGNERTIITSVYNRVAMDVAALSIRHVRTDEQGRFLEVINSGLNECLTVAANKDQTGRAFIQDVVASMFDEGCVAIVPVDTTRSPYDTESYDINSLRTGKITKWYPDKVTIRLYDDRIGKKKEITLDKSIVAIIENPLYAVMNEPNSTMQRLIRKLRLLDAVDDRAASNSLDMIIQLPYVVKSEARKKQAKERVADLESQLEGSTYGIAYIDGTERVTQLNRSVDNSLLKQIEYYQQMLYTQMGITNEIINGTADEKTMLNYQNRILEPIVSAIVDAMIRTFLSKTARTQHQSIMFFRDPLKLVPVSDIAEIADKFTRNEIASSNDIRQAIGWKPSQDPSADQLRNKNLNQNVSNTEEVNPTDQLSDTLQDQTQNQSMTDNWDPISDYTNQKQ